MSDATEGHYRGLAAILPLKKVSTTVFCVPVHHCRNMAISGAAAAHKLAVNATCIAWDSIRMLKRGGEKTPLP